MRLRRDTIVPVLAFLVIAVALPFAIVDTIETGRVYVFSRQFLEELPQRFAGPGRLRFILQPILAIVLGIRGGLADAKAGNPHYLFGLLFGAGRRKELLRTGVEAIGTLLAMGIILDVVFQLVIYNSVHPGAALLVGPILICLPYALSRALTTLLARRAGQSRFNKVTLVVLLPSLIALSGCQDLVPLDTLSLLIPSLRRSEVFGFLAGFGTTFAVMPDLIAMLRRRSSAGMNPRMAAIMGAFQILWVYYGLLIASRPVILWNVVAVLVNSLSVGAHLYFVRKEKK